MTAVADPVLERALRQHHEPRGGRNHEPAEPVCLRPEGDAGRVMCPRCGVTVVRAHQQDGTEVLLDHPEVREPDMALGFFVALNGDGRGRPVRITRGTRQMSGEALHVAHDATCAGGTD